VDGYAEDTTKRGQPLGGYVIVVDTMYTFEYKRRMGRRDEPKPDPKLDAKLDDEEERKASVIHTRIPEALDTEIRRRASSLGLSVSNLVRNVLLNTFGLVESVLVDSADVVARSARARERGAAAAVLAWQEVTLNLNALCDRCNAILPRGARAAIAVTDGPASRTFRCLACVKELADDRSEPDDAE
jgi:hypothetical protein